MDRRENQSGHLPPQLPDPPEDRLQTQVHLGARRLRRASRQPRMGAQLIDQKLWLILCLNEILHQPRGPRGMIPPLNTNEPWFPLVSKWCEMDLVHSMGHVTRPMATIVHFRGKRFQHTTFKAPARRDEIRPKLTAGH